MIVGFVGLIGGLMVAQLWPQKTVQAVATAGQG
jgi:hypothetical protein